MPSHPGGAASWSPPAQLAIAVGQPSFEAGLAFLARHPVPQDSCYQYFKEALIVWTITQSQKWFLAKGVRMNCVAPGPVWTPLNVADKSAEQVAKHGSAQPMKRPAQPEEVAPAFVFFASEADSSYITGEVLTLLGGETAAG